MLVGADGCPGGWAFAACDAPGGPISTGRVPTLSAMLDALPGVLVLAVDMPIGLPRRGVRRCDQLGKRVLGTRHTTLFLAPPAGVLDAASYEQACDAAVKATGKKISLQAWNLVPKIREVARLKRHRSPRSKSARCEIIETHPELCFSRLAAAGQQADETQAAEPGAAELPIGESKKSAEGQSRRLELLCEWFGDSLLDAAMAAEPIVGRRPPLVDQIDALACLVVAQRVALQSHTTLPSDARLSEPTISY